MMRAEAYGAAYQDCESVLSHFNTLGTDGLTEREVLLRRSRYGRNTLSRVRNWGLIGRIAMQFKSPLVLVLVGAAVVTFLLHELVDMFVILAALSVNVLIGAFQEERASRAFERLSGSQERFARVIRSGALTEISTADIVPGDIVDLRAGSYVPADLRLLAVKELSANEAVLTGEWIDVLKDAAVLPAPVPLAEQKNMVWMGTLITTGYGRGVVVATGDYTQMGLIAKDLHTSDGPKTPLEENIAALARFILYLVLGALVAIFVLGLLRGQPLGDLLLLSIAVAVAAMPEGLPAVVTVVLAIGMEAILKRGGLVRNLLAAETLGATTIILTDKTGTLTEARMSLSELTTLEILEDTVSADAHVRDDAALLQAAILASDAFIEEHGTEDGKPIVRGKPVEQALVRAGFEQGVSQHELLQTHPRLDYLQFESQRRFGASLNVFGETRRLLLSGAPELLIEASTYVYEGGKRKSFTEEGKQVFKERFAHQSGEGMRLIAAAYKEVTWETIPEGKGEAENLATGLTFMGLLAFTDPVRPDVIESIKSVQEAGARVIMVTGDNVQTAQKIAREVGIAGDDIHVYTGDDIASRDDEGLYELLQNAHVFARTLPTQKLRLVRVLKNKGEVVAMTGDGVNDAPALQNASIGVAVGSGTEVAKEASDIILVGDSFSIIVAAIEEGRRIIDNLKKVIAYLLATSSSEIILIGSSLIIGAPLPLLPTQILWANMVQEGLMSFAFAFEPKEPDVMKRSPRSHSFKTILTSELKRMIVVVSVISSLILIALFVGLRAAGYPIEEIRTIMFVALSLSAIFYSFSLKNLRKPLWTINPFSNRFLLIALTASLLTLCAAVLLPPLQYLLSLTPITPMQGLLLLGVGLLNLVSIEIIKYFVFRRGR